MNPEAYLAQAAELAAEVDPHLTTPNPRVGCVVVKNGEVIAQGAHQRCGEGHAEANALSGELSQPGALKGCEVAVTLEPCHEFEGKQTPSCTNTLIQARPKKVWVGALDPHFGGQSLALLKEAGIQAELVQTDHHTQLNPFFHTWITQHRPYICLKVGQTLDGRITDTEQYLTNETSRQHVHRLRAQYAAVLTTTATVHADDPQLNVRYELDLPHPTSNPRVLIMGQSGLPGRLKLHQVTGRRIDHLQTRDFTELVTFCRQERLDSLMTECGGIMNTALLQAGLVDEIQIFTAPQFAGADQTPSFAPGPNGETLDLSPFKLADQANLDGDLWWRYIKI